MATIPFQDFQDLYGNLYKTQLRDAEFMASPEAKKIAMQQAKGMQNKALQKAIIKNLSGKGSFKNLVNEENKLSRKLNTTPPNAKGTIETTGIKQPRGFYLGEGDITKGKQIVPYTPPNTVTGTIPPGGVSTSSGSIWDKLKGYGSKVLSSPGLNSAMGGLSAATIANEIMNQEANKPWVQENASMMDTFGIDSNNSLNIDPYLIDLDTQKARFGEAFNSIANNNFAFNLGKEGSNLISSFLGYGTDFNDSFKDGVPKDFYANKEQTNPEQQVITNQPAQSALTQEQALQMQQNNALLDSLNNESKINTLLASGAMRGSIDQANMDKWTDIQNYNAQGQAMADVRKAMNSKSAGFTPVEYQPIQIPQEFIQAQQLQNQLKTNPIHNINSYGMNIPNNVNNVSTINAKFGGTVNGKPVANGANIAGMFDNLGSREERRKKSQATFNSLNF